MFTPSPRPIAIDLFAGAGGFSLGIEQAGFDVVLAVEKDPVHGAVHQFNFTQTVVLCADAGELTGEDIWQGIKQNLPHAETLDLIVGGPPCQGFSSMGKREETDTRNGLVFEFSRLVCELQPRYFVMENVPGLQQGDALQVLQRVQQELEAGGYQITTPVQILNAKGFGVPQERKRLFLLGSRQGESPLVYPPMGEQETPTVKAAIADLPNLDEFSELADRDALRLSSLQLHQLETQASEYVQKLRHGNLDQNNYAYPRQWDPSLLTGLRQTHHQPAIRTRFQNTPPGKKEAISRLPRLSWEGYCPTLRAGTNSDRGSHTSPRPLHPQFNRVIGVREAARLHSFPDWFRLHVTKWHGFRQVGNAVPPLLARAIGQQVMKALGKPPSKPTHPVSLGPVELLQFTHTQAVRYWQNQ
ncbi:DNA cytosine methyltransferase [Spirulina sp. CS-785/01]|uniref:DNA cytosine methyltransferase n=1 Tax=Spirulina sp. CS-785/01 TaxID=3021716 RepID=UPI00232D9FAE|nr:DNA cytosine methyltransferase [Spirulina sp. CS-785/01]MDB9315666.1 DNA cytosine methyltransferase [Spirulina sp. CS-785/01]